MRYQGKGVKLNRFGQSSGVSCVKTRRERSGQKKKKMWKRHVKTILFALGAVSELAGIVLAVMPSGGAGNQASASGGDAMVVEQHITAEEGAQVYAPVGGRAEPAPEDAPQSAPEGLSEEERAYVDGLSGADQLACAYDYIQNRAYSKAEQTLEILLEDKGQNRDLRAAAFYNQGLARYYQKQTGSARNAFQQSTQLKGSAQAYYCLGIVNHEMGKYDQAVDAYSKAFLYENSGTAVVDLYLARGAAYESWNDAPGDKAREDYQSALELDPENQTALAGIRRLDDGKR